MIMIKKILKVSAIIFALIIAALIVYLIIGEWRYQETRDSRLVRQFSEYERAENYQIIDTAEGQLVVNPNVGLRVIVPKGWSVEIAENQIGEEGGAVYFSSPEVVLEDHFPYFPIRGCKISLGIERYLPDFPGEILPPQYLAKRISGEVALVSHLQEIATFREKKGLKMTREGKWGRVVSVQFARNYNIFYFKTLLLSGEEEECYREFRTLLSSAIF